MENFVVSARKYRPATFATVVGQRHITDTLKNAIERGQLAHAYLFCGPRGVGKTTCARIFAKTINCLNLQGGKGGEACGVCESCRSFDAGRSLNIHELDAASNNSVEDIRLLIEQVRIMPQIGRYSLFIIDEVHMLSTAAFNAFLKTLEEPPAHAIFILATTERHKILPTIISRCQCYDFNRIRVEDGAEYLRYIAGQEGVTIDDESLNLIAQKADGGMRDALSMFDKAVSFGGDNLDFKLVAQTLGVVDYDTYFALTDQLLAGDYHSAMVTFDRVLGMGFAMTSFLTGFGAHLRDLLVASNAATLPLLELTESMQMRYREQASRCKVEFIFGALSALTATDGELKRSSNQRLLVELTLIRISGLGEKKKLIESDTPSLKGVELLPKATVVLNEAKSIDVPVVTPIEREEPPQRVAPKTSSIFSLKSALTTKKVEEQKAVVETRVDADSEAKLNATRAEIIKFVTTARPRFATPFEAMTIEENTIKIEVPSQELEQEVRRAEVDLLTKIKDISMVDGVIELKVVINEEIRAKRPIKVEERREHFLNLNSEVAELTRLLDLHIEG
ncbi:MAG: DNA polymerase III subunit gamma/tau [Rikenellaceae bacterium]